MKEELFAGGVGWGGGVGLGWGGGCLGDGLHSAARVHVMLTKLCMNY